MANKKCHPKLSSGSFQECIHPLERSRNKCGMTQSRYIFLLYYAYVGFFIHSSIKSCSLFFKEFYLSFFGSKECKIMTLRNIFCWPVFISFLSYDDSSRFYWLVSKYFYSETFGIGITSIIGGSLSFFVSHSSFLNNIF